ncbi:MAG TPA: inositol monophosphatase [Beijerinckiaceae bacterium]|nr:inositol monophosphatase [Beijerinckiaceae bacterium]
MPDTTLILRQHALRSIIGELGDLALAYFRNRDSLGVTLKGAQDWLTEADGAVERLFRQRIAEAFPGDGVFGEEQGGTAGDAAAENLWIIDPIDGTANFATGDRQWCVSVGFLHRGVPELGAVLAPAQEELFLARRGGGATLNGQPIRANPITDLTRASVEIGWSKRRPLALYIDAVRATMEAGAGVKRSASGALGVVHTAMGRVDAYAEAHINSWDVAAALVIAREAGCYANDFFRGDAIVKGNPILVAAPGIAEAVIRTTRFLD